MLKPRTAVATVPAYHPPLSRRDGLRLDFNENTVGCSPRVLARLRALTADDLSRYPEREPIESVAADFLGVPASQLLLTNGVDEAIHLLCTTYLEPGSHALIVVPTYSMYRIYMMSAGAEVEPIPAGNSFAFPYDAVRRAITDRTRLIAIANPNNPTGTLAPADQLLALARSAPNAAVFVDEAYFEFCDQTLLPLPPDLPNLFVTRTFSKAYGLAGLRLGALIGDSTQLQSIRRLSSPYNVNAVALACLPEALADQTYIRNYVTDVLDSRARLERELDSLGIHYWPSRANFVLFKVGEDASVAQEFSDLMRARGILIRDRSSDPGCSGCVRITLGPRPHTDRLLTALNETLSAMRLNEGVRTR